MSLSEQHTTTTDPWWVDLDPATDDVRSTIEVFSRDCAQLLDDLADELATTAEGQWGAVVDRARARLRQIGDDLLADAYRRRVAAARTTLDEAVAVAVRTGASDRPGIVVLTGESDVEERIP